MTQKEAVPSLPPQPRLNEQGMLAWIRHFVAQYQTQQKAARALGVSAQYLCDVLKGRRDISAKLSRRVGYRREITFVRTFQ